VVLATYLAAGYAARKISVISGKSLEINMDYSSNEDFFSSKNNKTIPDRNPTVSIMITIPKKITGNGLPSNFSKLLKARKQMMPMVIARVHGKGVRKSSSFIEYILAICSEKNAKLPFLLNNY